jgi:FdhD protein
MGTLVLPAAVRKYANQEFTDKPDLVAVEEPLEIRVGYGRENERQQKSVSVTMRTPGHDFELAAGFLFTEGIITGFDEVESIKYCFDAGRQQQDNIVRVELKADVIFNAASIQRNFYATSSCGVCGKASIDAVRQDCPLIASNLEIQAQRLLGLPDQLRQSQQVFEHTGGLHAVGLFDADLNLSLLREDVGRHNAMDKVLGAKFFENQMPLSNYVVLVSGRASFELVQKAAMAGIPIMLAVGAPSSLAIELAGDCGMTLIGFVRDQRFNIYTHKQRILNY